MTERKIGKERDWFKERGIPYRSNELTPEQRAAMCGIVTNVDAPVASFMTGSEVVVALMARYSRAKLPLREVWVREFFGNDEQAGVLLRRVTTEFGDDSVLQLGTVSMMCEMVSQLGVKAIEDGRLGAYLEKSTRYVNLGEKVNGHYLYFRPPEIMQDEEMGERYEVVMDEAFETYQKAYLATVEYLQNKIPKKDEEKDAVYKAAVRAKALDLVRVFLPMATLTNVGFTMSAQSLEHMVNKMAASNLQEVQWLGEEILEEADKVLPTLTERVGNPRYGGAAQEHLKQVVGNLEAKAKSIVEAESSARNEATPAELGVKLVWNSQDNATRVVAGALYPYLGTGVSFEEAVELVRNMSDAERREIIEAAVGQRTDRRQKPGREFELAQYTLEVVSTVGEWRDMQRHRMLTPMRQWFTMELGYSTPKEFTEIEVDGRKLTEIYAEHMEKRQELYAEVSEQVSPEGSGYVVGFGNLMRWSITANLREFYHMLPLRAGPAGHSGYRRIAVDMFLELYKIDPQLVEPMRRFIDFSGDEERLGRMRQLENTYRKQQELGYTGADTFEKD